MALPNTLSRSDEACEVCSLVPSTTSTETANDLPGPGRLLGNLYSYLGMRVENGLGRVAVLRGRGPEATALEIRRILTDQSLGYAGRRKKLRKKCDRLARYAR